MCWSLAGGDGGSVRELLRHPQVEKITMVEIDGTVVEASKQFLPSLSKGLDDPKVDLRIGDGHRLCARCPR